MLDPTPVPSSRTSRVLARVFDLAVDEVPDAAYRDALERASDALLTHSRRVLTRSGRASR